MRDALVSSLLVLLLAACSGGPGVSWHGSPYPQPKPAPDLPLTDTANRPFRLADLQGRPVLVFFGYTNCPDVCPPTLKKTADAIASLGDQADQVAFVFVTVDPARDTPEAIRAYLDLFNPAFIGLWGPPEVVEPVARAYGVAMLQVPPEEGADDSAYLVTHTSRVFLIDAQGVLVTNYPFETPKEDIAADLRLALESTTR